MGDLSSDIASHSAIIVATGAQTDLEIIPAVTGKRPKITGLYFSSSAATTVLIEDESANAVFRTQSITQIAISAGELRLLAGLVSEALDITTSAGDMVLYVEWMYIK